MKGRGCTPCFFTRQLGSVIPMCSAVGQASEQRTSPPVAHVGTGLEIACLRLKQWRVIVCVHTSTHTCCGCSPTTAHTTTGHQGHRQQ